MDHPEFLGATVEKIAYEKAGILKNGAPAIVAEQDPRTLEVIEREALRVGAPRIIGGRDFTMHEENGRLVFEDALGLLDMPPPRLAWTPPAYQRRHGARGIARRSNPTSARACSSAAWRRPIGLPGCSVCARGRLVDVAPPRAEIWLDGGHNEEGGRVVAEAMADFEDQAPRPLVLICGTLNTKDTAGFLRHFKGLAQETLAVPIAGEHAGRSAEEVAAFAQSVGLNAAACQSVEAALRFLAAREWADAAAHSDRRIALSGWRRSGGQRNAVAVNGPATVDQAGCASDKLAAERPGDQGARLRDPVERDERAQTAGRALRQAAPDRSC